MPRLQTIPRHRLHANLMYQHRLDISTRIEPLPLQILPVSDFPIGRQWNQAQVVHIRSLHPHTIPRMT